MKIVVRQKDIKETFSKSREQSWRSLEHFLETNQRIFSFDDTTQTVTINVTDKSDAVRLMTEAGVDTYEIVTVDKSMPVQPTVKKQGRPKNTVFIKGKEKGMTINQYKKQIKANTLSKAEVIKRGILKKSELDKAIVSGKIQVIKVGNSERVTQESLQNYFG